LIFIEIEDCIEGFDDGDIEGRQIII